MKLNLKYSKFKYNIK